MPPSTATPSWRTVIGPTVPAGPAGPAAPAGPAGPAGPRGSDPATKSAAVRERFRTFGPVTALLRSFGFVTAPALSWTGPTEPGARAAHRCDARAAERDDQRDTCDDHRGRGLVPEEPVHVTSLVGTGSGARQPARQTSTDSKYSPARSPVRRLTCRSSLASSRSPARRRISGIQLAPVVHDDAHHRARQQCSPGVRKDVGDALDVRLDRGAAQAVGGPSELVVAVLREAEELVRVAMLLVVVDQARIRRGCDHSRERSAELEHPCIAVEHRCGRPRSADLGERLDPGERVLRVPEQEPAGLLDGAADPAVLAAEVRLRLRNARKVEVEVRRAPRRAGRARQDDPQHVDRLRSLERCPEREQLGRCTRREPLPDVRRGLCGRLAVPGELLRADEGRLEVATQRLGRRTRPS